MKWFDKFFKNVSKKEAISWAFYDFANSAYTVLILSFVFPIYFREVIAGGSSGDFWWGLAVSVSMLIGGLSSPIIGAIADHDTRRKRKFVIFGFLSMVGVAALYVTGPNMLIFSLGLFVAMNVCFEIAQTLYDSFLLHVSTDETAGRISGLGWGLGYLGGIVAMLLLRPLYEAGYVNNEWYKLTFPLTALFFFVFALPSFIFIKERGVVTKQIRFSQAILIGVSNTLRTIKSIRQQRNILWFIVGFYILNDALVTIFAFIPIFVKVTLFMAFSEIVILLLIVQLIGFPATIFFGWLSDARGAKKILLSTIFLWGIVVIAIALVPSKMFFYPIAVVAGIIAGSSQAIARSWFSKLIPKEKMCEFFGFNGFASKVAATTGPLLFGIISVITGNQRIAVATLVVYFIIAFFIFSRIDEVPVMNVQPPARV